MRRLVVGVVGCLLIALLATFPLVVTPFTRLIGHPDVDVTNHAWGPWWWWVTFGRGGLPWQTSLLANPGGGVLWFIDPFVAAVGAPLVGLVGVVGAYNLAILAAVAVGAAGGRALAQSFGASPAAAWIGAIAAVCGPYLTSEVHNGVSEAVGVGWSAFALAAGRRALAGEVAGAVATPVAGSASRGSRIPSWIRPWLPVGVWLGIAASGTWYYGFAAGLTIGTWAVLEARAVRDRARAIRFVCGALSSGVLAGIVAAPVLYLLRSSTADRRSLVVRGDVGEAVRELLLAHNAVDPRAFVAPGGFQSVDLAAGGEAFLHSSYVGLLALGLAGFGVWGRLALQRALLGAVPCAVFSLGVYLWWAGDWVGLPWGMRLALPFGGLVSLLPDGGATHAQRLAWPVVVTIAALAAVGAERLAARIRHVQRGLGAGLALTLLGALVTADLLAASPWPLARVEALDLRSHERIFALSRAERAAAGPDAADGGGVLDLPAEVGATMATSRYLVYQTASDLPIPYRPDARGGTARIFGDPWFSMLFLLSAAREEQVAALRTRLANVTFVDLRLVEERSRIRWIVLHQELERGRGDIPRLEAQLRLWFGEPHALGSHLTWDVRARKGDRGGLAEAAVLEAGR